MGSYSITYDATSVYATITGTVSGDIVTIWLRTDADPTTWITPSDGSSVTVSGTSLGWSSHALSPNTDYVINVRISHNGVPEMLGAQYFTTPYRTKPSHWSWTSAESTALSNHGQVSTITYLRWNAMVDKVREVQIFMGYSWDTRYLVYDATRCQLNNRVLTAARFNSINYNVMIFYSTHVPLVSSGDPVLGSYFLQLMSKVNDWIDSL